MTLAERRKQVKQSRDELSPMRGYSDSPTRKPKGKPHSRPDGEADDRHRFVSRRPVFLVER